MRMLVILVLVVGASAVFSGCSTIQSISVSDISKGPARRIRATDSRHGWLMVVTPTLDATAKLAALCSGPVTGIQTTTSMRNWLVVQAYTQDAMGWCQN